jgi:valyl-tRNA synthetase
MLEKAYAAKAVEEKWGAAWKDAALFHSAPSKEGKRAYTIVIPPPNVTGALHIGHALNNSLQDILVRYRRLMGDESCWVPGTDHGGIATQNVMEKQLKAESKTRQDLGRAGFLERMQQWTHDCKATILGQLTRLGCALDFKREAFTMDELRAKAVHHTFAEFFKEGLIYRGERIVNWCVRCGTALSDIEVEHEDRKGHLWHIRYPLVDDPKRWITVATTRPETMLGDTAVAVNPKDERYADFVGKKLTLPLTGYTLDVVSDEHVDRDFGTGAVKVTPSHDPNDFEIWGRHTDAIAAAPRQVIGFDGKMSALAGEQFAGLSREKGRDAIVKALEEEMLADGAPVLEKTEKYSNKVSTCYRCHQVIEPLVSEQWFMKMGPLAQKAIKASQNGEFKIWPERWTGPYQKWLTEIRDWCLSRQIWWGHRIPVWYDAQRVASKLRVSVTDAQGSTFAGTLDEVLDKSGLSFEDFAKTGAWRYEGDAKEAGVIVSPDKPTEPGNWLQDQDVLDTWFSSALWPLSVFGWPEETPDLNFYYPTSVLVTGYEILYLWVARMQMMGLHFKGKVPFTDAVIHGIVRDKSGKKMSKSLGNVVDPLTMMDKYGTDALRAALALQAYPGRDIPFAEDSLTGPRNFVNKLWNSSRFVLMRMPETAPSGGYPAPSMDQNLELADRWILSEYASTLAHVHEHMKEYNVAAAADELYTFLWDKYCDWYVELAKPRLEDPQAADTVRAVLVHVLTGTLKALHPFMPYITEELYGALKPYSGETADFILNATMPKAPEAWLNPAVVQEMDFVMEAVRSVRALRSQLQVPPGLELKAYHTHGSAAEQLTANTAYVKRLAKLSSLEPIQERPAQSAAAVAGKVAIYVPLEGIVDIAKECQRLQKDCEKLAKDLENSEKRLNNNNFIERAPQDEVAKIRARAGELKVKYASLSATLESLQSD